MKRKAEMEELLLETELGQEAARQASILKANSVLQQAVKKLQEQLGDRQEFYEQVIGSVNAVRPYPKFHYHPARKTGSAVVPVLVLSDWHIGEVVSANETEGFNRFDWEIAQAAVFHLVEDFLNWVEIQRGSYCIRECAVLCLGDYVSGDIHQELLSTNEFPLPVQTANAGTLLGEVMRRLAGHFALVNVWQCGADNHGRLQKKPQAKQKAANSMSYLVHYIANAAAAKCHNVRVHTSEAIKQVATVNGKKFLQMHGDTMKGWAGLPFYAFAREAGREAIRRMNTDRGFHYLALAHFHTPYFLEGRILGNGSLSGTSEFDHACGRHSLPCQVAFLVHPAHGIFAFTPFNRYDVKK